MFRTDHAWQAQVLGGFLRQSQHFGFLWCARRADPNTKNGYAAIQRDHANHQPRLGAGAARGMNHMINAKAKFHRLTKQFLCSINIAK